MASFIDMAGKRFGRLRVLRQEGKKSGHVAWRCICSCGNGKVISGLLLRRGDTRSCGCLYAEHHGPDIVDLRGKKFGKLLVLQRAGYLRKRVAWACRCDCGNRVVVTGDRLRTGNTRSCGRGHRSHIGNRNPAWTGGRYVDHKGYVLVWSRNHPNAQKKGYVREHVLVMAKLLGRPLRPGEMVHHKNGQPGDNRPQNLELWSRHHGCGQRVEDQIDFALQVLEKYPELVERRQMMRRS